MSKQSDLVNITQGDTITVDHANSRVGVNTTSPTVELSVNDTSAYSVGANGGSIALSGLDASSVNRDFGQISGLSVGNNTGDVSIQALNAGTMSEAIRVRYNGNVGIGTSSPQAPLEASVSQTSDYEVARFSNGALGSSFNAGAHITIGRPDIPRNLKLGIVGNGSSEFHGYLYCTETGGALKFGTQNTERMRIDASGNVMVGRTSASTSSTDDGHVFAAAGYNISNIAGTTSATHTYFQRNGSSIAGSITSTSSATSYNTSSDYRLKEDVQPMTGASDRVLALNPVNFAWKADGTRVDGFLAHEAQEVVPEAVHGVKDGMRTEEYEVTPAVYEDVIIPAVDAVLDEEGNVITEAQPERTEQRLVSEAVMGTREVPDYQGIDQSKLVPLLTAALQEALGEIAALKDRVAALEGA